MSTEIKTIEGTCHIYNKENNSIKHGKADISLTRFFNGKKKGSNIQITISQKQGVYPISYIHLNKKQCDKLAKILLNAFDYNKYPSE